MADPLCRFREPIKMTLQPGEYHYCACGRSKSGVFCDGTHEGTGIQPVPFQVTQEGPVILCGCRKTKRSPYCDGSHHNL
jgi:CDGSH-type Zn-finger protein